MKGKKLALISGIVAVSLVSAAVGAWAATDIKLFVNGKQSTVDLQIIDGSSYVPLRAVSEMLGADVKWDGDARTITITGKDYHPAGSLKSFNVNVNVDSGPMKMNISKVTLDPSYSKDEYQQKTPAIVFDVTVENTSDSNVFWSPAQGTVVLNTKEQIDGVGGLMYSDDVGGHFMGKVIKKGKLVIPIKNSNLDDISSLNFNISAPINDDSFSPVGVDTTTAVILK